MKRRNKNGASRTTSKLTIWQANAKKKIAAYRQWSGRVKNYLRKVWAVFFHAIWMILLTILLQYVNLVRFDEVSFLKWSALVKHYVFFSDPKPLGDSIVFIDLSRDLQLTEDPGLAFQGNDSIEGAKVVIKDRAKLALFFNELNKHAGDYKFVLCDVLFTDPAPADILLRPAIESTEKVWVPCDRKQSETILPIFSVPFGYAQYNLANGKLFTKMPLMYTDSLKNLAVVMYEGLTNNTITRRAKMTYINNKLSFNLVMPEMYYRPTDLRRTDEKGHAANIFYLGEILTEKDFFNRYCKNKYIILGDFASDNHSTYAGGMPGSLLLLDTYLTLLYKNPVISTGWIFILFIFYFVISYFLFILPAKKFEGLYKEVKTSYLKKILSRYISYIGLLILIDILSYVFYGIFISIFYMASYLTFLKTAIEKYPAMITFLKKLLVRKPVLRFPIFIGIAMLPAMSKAQTFTVKAIQGNVFYNNKLIGKGDTLTDVKKLTADNRLNKIRILNPEKGSYLINFFQGSPVAKSPEKHSELYEVFVQEYIDKYNKDRLLATKGKFDWLYFFIDSAKGRMAIFTGQKIPLSSGNWKADSSFRFVAVLFHGKDTTEVTIPIVNDSLYFSRGIFPEGIFFQWKLKARYQIKGVNKEKIITDEMITSLNFSASQLKLLCADFSVDWQQYYASVALAKKDLYDYLFFSYGVFYKPYLEPIVEKEFAATK